MTVFAVIPSAPGAAFDAKVSSVIPAGDALKLPCGEWLVSHQGTSKDLSDALEVSLGNPSGGVILSISGYYGRASPDVWEFIKKKLA